MFQHILAHAERPRRLEPAIPRRLRWANQRKARERPLETSKLDEYRANARECEGLAEQTHDAHLKEQFLKTAQQWREMAAYEENRGQC